MWKDTSQKISQEMSEYLLHNKAYECFIGFDNPRLLISERQPRSAVGLWVDKEIADKEKIKEIAISNRMRKVSIPETQVLMLNVDMGRAKGLMYRLLWWYMARQYETFYGKKMAEHGVSIIPLGELRTPMQTAVFMPLPEYVKHFDFSGESVPEYSPTGKWLIQKYGKNAKKSEPVKTELMKKVAEKPIVQEKIAEVVKQAEENLVKKP